MLFINVSMYSATGASVVSLHVSSYKSANKPDQMRYCEQTQSGELLKQPHRVQPHGSGLGLQKHKQLSAQRY